MGEPAALERAALGGDLITAGLRDGKGTPEHVVAHPRVFAFTAPGFGPVHNRPSSGTPTQASSGGASPSTRAARSPRAGGSHNGVCATTPACPSPRSPSTKSAVPSTSTP
ncbi:replication initiator [Streptomyces sp. MUSC 14]|uniref:replication initiator n=1 Tax=Streptomyces sp. MUSC 14 TaxID=1354889 RepID=UPI0035286917